ncbi:hypothetical protein [Methylomonas albis]|nr:hypothetical protein [Methylomonas albis]
MILVQSSSDIDSNNWPRLEKLFFGLELQPVGFSRSVEAGP